MAETPARSISRRGLLFLRVVAAAMLLRLKQPYPLVNEVLAHTATLVTKLTFSNSVGSVPGRERPQMRRPLPKFGSAAATFRPSFKSGVHTDAERGLRNGGSV
jgi:hypothetical protein